MKLWSIAAILLLLLTREAEGIQCSSCLLITSSSSQLQQALTSAFSRVFNPRCADDNPSGLPTIQCPGSCEHVTSTVGSKDNNGRPLELRIHMRQCNALRSLDVGCQTLTMADEKRVKGYIATVFGSANDLTSVRGRYCMCNSDGCNTNTRNLPTMAPVPIVQCHRCQWKNFQSSDANMAQMFNSRVASAVQKACSDSRQIRGIPMTSCRGSCAITNSTVHMTARDGRYFRMQTIERDCVPVRTASRCMDAAPKNQDGDIYQRLLQQTGFSDVQMQNLACTCSGNGCNGEDTQNLARLSGSAVVHLGFNQPTGSSSGMNPGAPRPMRPPMNGPVLRPSGVNPGAPRPMNGPVLRPQYTQQVGHPMTASGGLGVHQQSRARNMATGHGNSAQPKHWAMRQTAPQKKKNVKSSSSVPGVDKVCVVIALALGYVGLL